MIQDTIAPVISGVPGSVIDWATSSGGAVIHYPMPTATDNVCLASLTATHESGSVFPIGTSIVKFTATDTSGNKTTASFSVTVLLAREIAGTYAGLIKAPANEVIKHGNTGYQTLTVSSSGVFSSKLIVSGKEYNITGVLGSDGVARQLKSESVYEFALPRTGQSNLILKMYLDVEAEDKVLHGQIMEEGVLFAEIEAYRKTYATTPNPSSSEIRVPVEILGKYTSIVVLEGGKDKPQVSGTGLIDVSSSGVFSWAGTLMDGTRFSGAWPILQESNVPMYLRLYNGSGSISGNLIIRDIENISDVDGEIQWFRPHFGNKSSMLKDNVDYAEWEGLQFLGSRYQMPSSRVSLFSDLESISEHGNAEVVWSGHAFSDFELQVGVNITNKDVVNLVTQTPGMKLLLDRSNGSFRGGFRHPKLSRNLSLSGGVVFQKQSKAIGFFIEGNGVGLVELLLKEGQ